MANVSGYWRPASLKDALALLERPGAVVMGGGTRINAAPSAQPVEVVDLQTLRLDRIERAGRDRLRIGATTTLQQLAGCADAPASIREAARRELPSTLRAQSTVGGAIMSRDPESELLATLLVHSAMVSVARRAGVEELPLANVLAHPALVVGGIVVAVSVETDGITSTARTGRTRADRSIVAAVVRRTGGGERRLAMTGVAAVPVVVDRLEDLDPPADFRGSKEYRRSLAATLARRALEAVA